MNGGSVTFKVDLTSHKPWTTVTVPPSPPTADTPTSPVDEPPVSRAAQALALAYEVEHLFLSGRIPSYAVAAEALGVSQPQLVHTMLLLHLSPDIQEALLLGKTRLTQRRLRVIATKPGWSEQQANIPT